MILFIKKELMQNSAALAKIGGISGTFREKPYQGLHAFFYIRTSKLEKAMQCS